MLALGGLALAVAAFARTRDSPAADGLGDAGQVAAERTIDLVAWAYAVQPPPGFQMVDGRANKDFAIVIDGTRTMIVTAGTPGEIDCPELTALATCTVAADLLGDGVLWFSIVPGSPGATVQLPAVSEVLDGGWARLANGWVVRHAPKVDRSCPEASASLSDFISTYGDRATSTFNFEQQELVKVTCGRLPEGSATTTTTSSVVVPPIDATVVDSEPVIDSTLAGG